MEELSLHLLDLAQNSISAGATLVELSIRECTEKRHMWVKIRDNGQGMDKDQLNRISDPFYTTRSTRKVGLGVPLFRASAEATGGSLQLDSQKGEGTTLLALFLTSHIDCIPLGSMEDTMATLIFLNPEIDFVYTYENQGKQLLLDTRQIREILGDVNIANPAVIDWVKEYIIEGFEELNGGA